MQMGCPVYNIFTAEIEETLRMRALEPTLGNRRDEE